MPTRLPVPRAMARLASTPCHSGVTQARGWSQTGSCEIGKKVPEKSFIGVCPSRKRRLKPPSFSCRAENATTRVVNASPVSTATGSSQRAAHERKPPKAAATPMKITAAMLTCVTT